MIARRFHRSLHCAVALSILATRAASASGEPGATPAHVHVRVVDAAHRAIEGAAVRAGSAHAASDAGGAADLTLPAGSSTILVVRMDHRPDTLTVRLAAGADTTIEAVLHEQALEFAPVIVASTRNDRRMEDEPERVEVLAGEDIDEKSESRPADITTAVSEIPGVRVQVLASASGAAALRIQGLRAQYTSVLVDGLPLAGAGEGAGFGLLQMPPLDLQQAEVVKGTASALYGPSALGGVLDLVTKRPGETPERTLVLDQGSRGATDAELWVSRRLGARWGMTLLAGAHRQELRDADHDGWADAPGFRRAEIRPRLFWTGEGGRAAALTIGAMAEDREGGGEGDLRRRDDTRHGDGGLTARLPIGACDVLDVRASWSESRARRRQFDPAIGAFVFDDRRGTGFAEATWRRARGRAVLLAGIAIQRDDYANAALPSLERRTTIPAVLAQGTWALTPWCSASAAARADATPRWGVLASPRLSLLAHAGHALEARLSAGGGFRAPDAFMDETADLPLARITAPAALAAERAGNVALDLTARRGALEFNATLFASRIAHPVLGAEGVAPPSGAESFVLANAVRPTRTRGWEGYALWSREPIVASAGFSWIEARETDPASGIERDVPLTPRTSASLDIAWEEDESGTRIGVEAFYTGRQAIADDPARTEGAAYARIGLLASQRLGRATFWIDAENLADIRQARYEPIPRPVPSAIGRLAAPAWAPGEGRTLSAGVRLPF